MNSSFNLPPGCTHRDCDGIDETSEPIVCDGCGYSKASVKFIKHHDAELCAACDREWTAREEQDAKQAAITSPNFENTVEAFLMRD